MKINKIKIHGFRNINHTDISFDDLTALISLNCYGKSNVFMAIDFGISFIKCNESSKKEKMSWSEGLPLNIHTKSTNFTIEFELTMMFELKEYDLIYGYEFSWANINGEGAEIINEYLKMKQVEKNQRFIQLFSRNTQGVNYKSSETGRCSNIIKIEKDQLLINKMKAYDNLYYIEIIKQINNINIIIERHLDTTSLYGPDPFIRNDSDILKMGNDENIPRLIYTLKKTNRDKYEMLVSSFIQLFPNIKNVMVEELELDKHIRKMKEELPKDFPFRIAENTYYLMLVDDNLSQPISFDKLSDGARRVFLMLTYALLADIRGLSLIAIEEPENSIHPSLLQNYLHVLKQMLSECKVIITSHSPYVINYLSLEGIYIGIPSSDGLAHFSRIQKSKKKALLSDAQSLNESAGAYIFDLMCGSNDDISQLSGYLE